MAISFRSFCHIVGLLVVIVFCIFALVTPSFAHPEDEFCSEDSGMDPALCRELAKLDSDKTEETALTPTAISLDRPVMATVRLYVHLGFVHIIPRGTDHILFILALFLASTRWRALLWQISAFTLAHTIAFGLAAAGWINVPSGIVEPLIALSIAVVAIENIFFRDMTKWRPLIVFGFGLFHGLGFAGVLSDLGLERGQFLTSLISFNVGVEAGQLAMIALAFIVALGLKNVLPAPVDSSYRKFVVIPASLLIALIGLFWFATRLMG